MIKPVSAHKNSKICYDCFTKNRRTRLTHSNKADSLPKLEKI